VSAIDDLAATVRQALDAADRDARARRPQLCPACKKPIIQQEQAKLLDGTTYGCGHYFTWDQVFDHAERTQGETTSAMRLVARDRKLVDRLLAEPHHGSCPYWRNDPDEWPCDCGQDRLRTDCLTLLAEPYQEGLE
jgi:hypothetical protein